jgi:HJR/Mrr/RecB family endonuclease
MKQLKIDYVKCGDLGTVAKVNEALQWSMIYIYILTTIYRTVKVLKERSLNLNH